ESTFTASSFHFLAATASSNALGACSRNLPSIHKSAGKVARSLTRFTILTALALSMDKPSFSKSASRYSASSSSGFALKYCSLYHLALLISNFVPDLPILSTENASTSSSMLKISLWSPGFHPKKAKKLMNASGRYPDSLNPLARSPDSGSVQLRGKIGKPCLSASRFDSLPLPSGFNNRGKWANCGMVSSQPRYLYSNTCSGAEG